MRINLLLIFLLLSLLLFFSRLGLAQVNEYSLVPVDLQIGPGDNTVQVNININTIEPIVAFIVPLFAEGTSNPVLDTLLTGGLWNPNPPAFDSPSLVAGFTQRIVNPYGPPADPLLFVAVSFGGPLPPSTGLYCRMFYRVSGPGTITFRTALHSTAGSVGMNRPDGSEAPINWPVAGEVGSYSVTYEPPDCNKSYTDPCIKICPAGDIPFNVFLKGSSDNPIVGYSNIWLDFSSCSGITPCTTQQWTLVYPTAPSDSSGKVTFYMMAGGCDTGCLVQVKASCGTIASVPVRTLDNSGNLYVSYSDFDDSYGLCRDYNCDDTVDYKDLSIFNEHKRHSCTTGPPDLCQLFRKYLVVDPDTNLSPGKTTKVTIFVQNNSTTDCSIDSIKFYYSGFGALDTLKQFSFMMVGFNLSPGDSVMLGADYLWLDTTATCFYARLYTDCCSTYIQSERCINRVRQCPPSAMDFKFGWKVGFSPVYTETLAFIPPGWSYSIDYPVLPDSGVIIRTSSFSPLGTKGSLLLASFADPGRTNFMAERTFEVFVTLRNGDTNGDCNVSVSDVIYIINYLFKNGSEPKPLRAADTNCDGMVTVTDVVYLINYLFKNGPPPPCNE